MKQDLAAIGLFALASTLVDAQISPSLVARQGSPTSSASVSAVSVRGNAFWRGNERFYVRGIAYQPGGASDAQDPLAAGGTWKRDLPYFKELNINTIRVYTVDNAADHDEAMRELAAAGIYVALDINTPKYSINRDRPGPSYNPTYLQNVFATMDAFSKYNNTLLFFNGNEVINTPQNSDTAPFVKAVGRDMKTYRNSRSLRAVPIGYSAADVEENRYETALYFNCGPDDQRSDFFAFNDYSWCDPETYANSQWEKKVQQYGNYSLPLFLSEYGCIENRRDWNEVAPLYDQMTPVYSGGLAYEYTMEANNYGVVSVSGGTVTKEAGFDKLAAAFAANPAPSGSGGARTAASQPNSCPPVTGDWALAAFPGEALPATPSGAVRYFREGAGKGPGLAGAGSQDAPGGSTATAAPGSGSATAYASGGGSAAAATATASPTGAAGRVEPASLLGAGVIGTLVVGAVGVVVGAALL